MKKKTFLKILGIAVLSLLVMFVAGVVIMHLGNKKMIRERLSTETRLVASLIEDEGDYAQFEQYYENDELRITVLSLDGEVLFESDVKNALPVHLNRKELRYALEGRPQAVERYSETLGCKMTYYAVKTELKNGNEVLVRLALKGSEITSYALTALPFFLLSLGISVLLASVLSNKLSKEVSQKIEGVGDSLKSLNEGEYIPLETDEKEGEFSSVFHEINELNGSIHSYIQREEGERRKLTVVLDNVAQGIVALNAKKEIVFINDSALVQFGGSADNKGGLAYLIDDSALCEKIESNLGEEGFSFAHEYRGKYLTVIGKRISGEENEEGLAYILLFTDTTAEREVIRQKSEFFANASHELKTPITVMRGLTEILLTKEDLDEQEQKQIARIHKESLRMAELISDMLKLSKLERNEQEDRAEVEIRELAEEVVAELAGGIEAKNITVSLTGRGKVFADPKNVFEVVQNLCSNAVNYNKQDGSIAIDIKEDEKGTTLTVADSGIGVDKEHIPRLCERFYRVDKSRSKKTGGTGLGLAIVKHVCARYKAEMEITSEIGKGTQVRITFPRI